MYRFDPEIIPQILELASTIPSNKISSDCRYFTIFKSTPFPNIPSSVIRNIRNSLDNRGAMVQILFGVNFCFPLITRTVSDIAEEDLSSTSPANRDYWHEFLFFSFVS
jgi:hypothetical protein